MMGKAATAALGREDARDWIPVVTHRQAPPLVPEMRLAGLPPDETMDSFRTRHSEIIGAATPYWVVAWPGGQALARYILDHPAIVAGKRVLDIGCGSGICAIAAAMAGAADVIATDNDRMALCAAEVCAGMNDVHIRTRREEFGGIDWTADVICAGDLWYDRATGRQATAALSGFAGPGKSILIGDALRPGRPRLGVVERARYTLAVPAEFGHYGQQFATVSELVRRS